MDLCATENLTPKPNSQKGSVIAKEDKDYLVEVTLSDSAHCRMAYGDLATAGNASLLMYIIVTSMYLIQINLMLAGLQISANTVKKILAENNIHCRKPTEKPNLKPEHRDARLAFCLRYQYQNWQEVIFTDETYFETGDLRRRRARRVLRRPGEAYLLQNMNVKFPKGATVMFWGAILHGNAGMIL